MPDTAVMHLLNNFSGSTLEQYSREGIAEALSRRHIMVAGEPAQGDRP